MTDTTIEGKPVEFRDILAPHLMAAIATAQSDYTNTGPQQIDPWEYIVALQAMLVNILAQVEPEKRALDLLMRHCWEAVNFVRHTRSLDGRSAKPPDIDIDIDAAVCAIDVLIILMCGDEPEQAEDRARVRAELAQRIVDDPDAIETFH
jgi:hypothetical protein